MNMNTPALPWTDAAMTSHGGNLPADVQAELISVARRDGVVEFRVVLINHGTVPVDFNCHAPVLSGLAPAGVTAYLPVHGGAVLPVTGADYTVHNLGGLTASCAILQGPDGAGVVMAQEKPAEAEARYRTGLYIHGRGLPAEKREAAVKGVAGSLVETERGAATQTDSGGVVAFVESVVLAPGERLELGPYLVATYQGTWMDGAALLRHLRWSRPRRSTPAWFAPVRNMGEAACWHRTMERFADYPEYAQFNVALGAPLALLFQWNWLPRRDPRFWWAYSVNCPADEHYGGDAELRAAIATARQRGLQTLLYTSFCSIGIDGPHAQRFRDNNWYMLCEPGRTEPVIEYGGCGDFLAPCIGLPEVRAWIVEGLVDLVRKYEPAALFMDETAAIGYRPCYNPAHRHEHHYVWTWGIREILRAFRERMDSTHPDLVILLEGSSELLREFVDGYACHSHSFTGQRHSAPVTRAICGDLVFFESAFNAEKPMVGGARQFAFGERYMVDQRYADRLHEHQRYRLAYPEIFEGELLPLLPRFEMPVLPGCTYSPVEGFLFRHSGKTVLTVANTGGEVPEVFVKLTMPLPARQLYDRVRAEFVDLNADAGARLKVRAYETRAFEVIAP